MKILKQLLKDQSLDKFLDRHFTRLPFSSPASAKEFTDLNWSDVEEVINQGKSILRIVKDGQMIKDYAELSYVQALEYYKSGHTLLLKNAELSHPKFKRLSEDFSKSFHTPVDVQLYCTPGTHNAFGWHYDVEEVFIIQVKGSKQYTIRQNTIHPNPLVVSIQKDQHFELEKSEMMITVLLKEGDWLYIPSGWWHIARTQEESMHISVGLMPRSAVDLASFLTTYLAQDAFWRVRMPVHKTFANAEEEFAFYEVALKTLGKDIQEKISSTDFLKKFLSSLKQPINDD